MECPESKSVREVYPDAIATSRTSEEDAWRLARIILEKALISIFEKGMSNDK